MADNELHKKLYLTDSSEWLLLQELSARLSQRKASHRALPTLRIDQIETHYKAGLLEIELRRTFMVQQISRSLLQEEFEHCQEALKKLCSCLDRLALHRSFRGNPEGQKYAHLRALIGFLDSTPGPIDLVNGPNEKLFMLPNDADDLGSCLQIVTECNDTLGGLFTFPLSESVARASRTQREKTAWKKNEVRDQAIRVIKALFEHFKCGMSHEVLLKLSEDQKEDLLVPNLQLMLSLCPDLESWEEAQYGATSLDNKPNSRISNICRDLQQNTDKRMALRLHIKERELYGAWEKLFFSATDPSSRESLDRLIRNGALRRPDVKDFKNKSASTKYRTKDKRKLAVKLGYSLMDFFDADFTSDRIHLLDSPSPNTKEIPYLAFGSNFPTTNDPYVFQRGHPTLLSFAKLLLEIELGQIIDLEVNPNSDQNHTTWAELVRYVDILEQDKSDSYLQAIRNCLLVYHKIAKKLNSRDSHKKGADSKIRKILYKQIVCKLELGLNESTPRSSRKRQRSRSPSPNNRHDKGQAVESQNLPIRPIEPDAVSLSSKRRRTPGVQQRSSYVSSESLLRDNSDSFKNDVPRSKSIKNNDWPENCEGFEIALICALHIESDAVEALFDEYYEDSLYVKASGDPNAYTVGKMAGHHVVLAFMPGMGKVNSANVAAGFRASFPKIKLGIVVGICGGVPGKTSGEEVLLGDVIISTALTQYDFARQYDDKILRRDTPQDNLSRPSPAIRSFLSKYSGLRGRKILREKTSRYLENLCAKNEFRASSYPGADNDILYNPTYRHKHRKPNSCNTCENCQEPDDEVCDAALESSCAELGCEESMTISRARVEEAKTVAADGRTRTDEELREAQKPFIYFGGIASGDSVMKSGTRRDKIALRDKVIAFEMEGAGVWDSFPTVVIKSVCDYADSHKNKMWQKYAAASAAACMKAFLEEW